MGVFSAPEIAAIRNGATLALSREPWLTEAAYQGTDYAIVKKGTAGYGVVDRAGNFVIPTIGDEYGQYIYRMDDTFFIDSSRQPQSKKPLLTILYICTKYVHRCTSSLPRAIMTQPHAFRPTALFGNLPMHIW